LRWLAAGDRVDPGRLRTWCAAQGGHATLFRAEPKTVEVFHPLDATMLALHRRLKAVFDPRGVFNRGRFVTGL
jgi:glycolate oxidase FAD binding subunit